MKIVKNKIVYEENISNIPAKATAVIFPDSIQEIKNLLKESTIDITPRAGGTSFVGGCIPQESIILDLSKMHEILEIDPSRKLAVVEPGVIVSDLNEELEEYGLEFPLFPLFPGIETIGGIIATDANNEKEIKYGKIINWIETLEIVNARGEQVKISKSDLSEVVGMEGITGLIIKASLRLTTKKNRSITILKSENIDQIIKTNKKLRINQDICSIFLIDKKISGLFGFEEKNHIFVEYESEKGLFKGKDYLKYYKIKNSAYDKISKEKFFLIESFRLLGEDLQEFLVFLEEQQVPYFGYLSSGVIFCCFRKEDIAKKQDVFKMAKRLRARISQGMGFGLTNKEYLPFEDKRIITRIKERYDPVFKINKNKLIDFTSFDKDLKQETLEAKESTEELEIKRESEEQKESTEEKAFDGGYIG